MFQNTIIYFSCSACSYNSITPLDKVQKIHVITARKRSLGQGNILTPVCHSVHRGGACVVAPGGACMHGFIWGGHAWFYLGACMVLFRGCVWFFSGGMHGFIQGGVHGFIQGGMRDFSRGVCGFSGGDMHGFSGGGGMCGFFSFFGYNEIQSMSRRYASYWNAFLF